MKQILFQSSTFSPSKIICIGRNYADHTVELGNDIPDEMVVFLKPNSSISTTLSAFKGEPLHYEGEISFLIKDAQIAGVGFGLDLTKRNLQTELKIKGLPWEKAKAFDGAACFSEFVPVNNVSDLSLELHINHNLVQKGGVEHMLFKPDEILSELKTIFSLEDGDIIMSGTPKGVGGINAKDSFIGKVYEGDVLLIEHEWTAG